MDILTDPVRMPEEITSDVDESIVSPSSILSLEIKELRNKIVSVKKSVTKGDKKQKKAVQDEVESLEALLLTKQNELKTLKEKEKESSQEQESNDNLEKQNMNLTEKINKNKMKRERRADIKNAAWEANRQAALAEIASRPDLALQEAVAFNQKLSAEGFRVVEVSADGHCMYSAIGCQLVPTRDHWELRKLAGEYIQEHRDDFELFIEFETTEGSNETETDNFLEYCNKVKSTGLWGGQIELEALSRVLDIPIVVIQAEGPQLTFNTDSNSNQDPIYLSFHRYAFSLGEHYNALVKD